MIAVAIRSILLAHPAVARQVDDRRIYPLAIPEGESPAFPAITYMQVSRRGAPRLSGPTRYRWARYQASCWANSYAGAHSLARATESALGGFAGTVSGIKILNITCEVGQDLDGVEAGLYGVPLDFFVQYHEQEQTDG